MSLAAGSVGDFVLTALQCAYYERQTRHVAKVKRFFDCENSPYNNRTMNPALQAFETVRAMRMVWAKFIAVVPGGRMQRR